MFTGRASLNPNRAYRDLAQLAAVQLMMFDQLEHTLSVCLCLGHDRARHWNGGLDTLVKRGVEKPDVFPRTMARELFVVHGREASRLYCC